MTTRFQIKNQDGALNCQGKLLAFVAAGPRCGVDMTRAQLADLIAAGYISEERAWCARGSECRAVATQAGIDALSA